jgi:RNA polymerase sigma factor for flagellar operon FliA
MYTSSGHPEVNTLLEQHADLVKKLAYQLKARLPASVEVDDLIQTGMIGLMEAVSRYDESAGAQFETYAAQRIRGAMLDELRSNDWLPRNVRDNMRKIETAINAAQQKLGRAPRESEIAATMGIPMDEYQKLLDNNAGHQLLYYEDFQHEDENEHFLDRYTASHTGDDPLQALLDEDFRSHLIDAIEALPEREKLLMGLYYEQELNLKETGAVLGVTESRVSQMHSQAVARIRSHFRN